MEVNSLAYNLFENPNNQSLQPDSEAAKLAVIGGAIVTLGDAITTMAAILAIEEARQQQGNAGGNSGGNSGGNTGGNNEVNKNMQKQIDYLTSELDKMKRQMNRYRR